MQYRSTLSYSNHIQFDGYYRAYIYSNRHTLSHEYAYTYPNFYINTD
jgi:hypothetical protein